MNNFEKRQLLEYFMTLLNYINFRESSFDDFFEDFIYTFNIQEKIFEPYYKEGSISRAAFLSSKNKEQFCKIIKSTISKIYSKVPKSTCLLEKQLLIIKKIYSLNDKEYKTLLYFALKETNALIEKLFDCERGRFRNKSNLENILKIKSSELRKVIDNLRYKNLVDNDSFDVEINDFWNGIFNNEKYNTQEKIVAKVIGKPLKSTLTLNDFKHIETEGKDAINILSAAVKEKKKGVNILLYGAVGTGKTEFAKLMANTLNINMYGVITQKEQFKEADREERLINLSSKQCILEHASNNCILFDEAEDVMNTGFSFFFKTASKGHLNHILETGAVPVIWTTNNIEDVDPAFLRRMTYTIEFEKLPETSRFNIWKRILRKNKIKVSKSQLEDLTTLYDVSPSIISNAASTAKMLCGDINDVERFINNVSNVVYKKKNINSSERFKKKEYDINLVNTDLDMNDLTNKIKQSGKLNFSLCLYGEPGTGKSLYARYLADKIGVDVVLKKASDLMSCYVGETEKNIAKAFSEAKSKKAMLIIDEADSFLQNRNNAHRSWEVTQVNEMLTWMESHQYPFVCTTNLINSLDEASLRRFTFKVKFDFLTHEQVNSAIEHFFGIRDANVNIKGLTAGDFATVKKKTDFLGFKDINEITKMLNDEVKVKKSPELQNSVGF